MTDKEIKQAIEGFTQFMRAVCVNPNLTVPKELAERFDISEEFCENKENMDKE